MQTKYKHRFYIDVTFGFADWAEQSFRAAIAAMQGERK